MKTSCFSKFKRGAVVISIDDGNADNFRLYENILLKHKFGATFNIISSRIGEETSLTKEQLRIIYNNPLMEVAAHGYAHRNVDEDIKKGIETLYDWLGMTEDTIGFASPGSGMVNKFIEENTEHLKSLGLLYVRTAGNPDPNERHLELQKELKNKGASDYVIYQVPQLTYSFDSMCVNSIVVFSHTGVDDLKTLVDLAAEERACLVFMFHNTKKKGEENYDSLWNYDYDKFEEFAEYLSKKRDEKVIDLLTNRQAFLIGSSH